MQHVLYMKVHRIGAFPPEGAGRFGAAWWTSEGVRRNGNGKSSVSPSTVLLRRPPYQQ